MIELLRILAPWVNGTGKQKAGTLSTVVVLLALAIYAAQVLLLPALTDATPAAAPVVEAAPAAPVAPQPVAPAAPDATPSAPLDGTGAQDATTPDVLPLDGGPDA
jgi:hypothetical protein